MFPNKIRLISRHESANQTRGKRLDTRDICPTFTGLTTPLSYSICIVLFYIFVSSQFIVGPSALRACYYPMPTCYHYCFLRLQSDNQY